MLGRLLAEIDHIFYATVCNPQELTCQRIRREFWSKNFGKAWELLMTTKGERGKLPIRNALTLGVVVVLGLWLLTSSPSWLGAGIALGLGTRLWVEMASERDYEKWYWVFDRRFALGDHRMVVIVLGIVLFAQFMLLLSK
jgi:hypothetical protein